MFNPLDLTGKLILVTGASSGIGRATAVVLARLGASLILSGRREAELQATVELVRDGAKIYIEPFDLTDTDAIPSWIQRLVTNHGSTLQGIVHAAGVGNTYPIRVSSRKRIDEIMGVNVYASLSLLRAVSMKAVAGEDGCSVVFISSTAALAGGPGRTVYSGSKAALHSIAKSAALELAPKRIRVNCIAPAWVDTPMLQKALQELPDGVPDLHRQVLGLIAPEEVGTAAAYLISDAARHVTGTTLVLDGGGTC